MARPKKLTGENYFSPEMNQHYVGSTQFKAFMECESSALAELRGEYVKPKTKALLMGSMLDAMFEGTIEDFKAKTPEIMNSRKPGALLADYVQVELIYERLSRDAYFMETMSGEAQKIYTGEIQGVPVKIKVDSMHPDRIVDLKLMKDFQGGWKNGVWVPWWRLYGYDIQAAIYREIVRQNTGKILPFEIAAATKEKESETGDLKTDFDVFRFTDADLKYALEYVRENIVHVQKVKQGVIPPNRCDNCKYCRDTKVLTSYRLFEEIEI